MQATVPSCEGLPELYERDFVQWCGRMAGLLREQRLKEIDLETSLRRWKDWLDATAGS